MSTATADALGVRGCPHCRLVFAVSSPLAAVRCPRCHASVPRRIANSVQRTWALLITALMLYLPANLLPVLHSTQLGYTQSHTIIGGIIELAQTGAPELAVIVFIASVVVPVLKIGALAVLAGTAARAGRGVPSRRARVYRLIEAVGHWSMLDIFVVVLAVALMRFGSLASVEPGAGAIAFGAVVVLTMLASASFDPRLLWDGVRQ